MTDPLALVEAVRSHLGSGVVDFDDLVDWCMEHTDLEREAIRAGIDAARYLDDTLTEDGRFLLFGQDVRRLDLLLDAAVFTHRLSPEEVATGTIRVEADLPLVDFDGADEFETPSGEPVKLAGDDDYMMIGPEGWLAEFSPGDLVAIRRSEGVLTLERPEDLAPSGEIAAEMKTVFETLVGDRSIVDSFEVMLPLLASETDAFRVPTTPVSELVGAVGLEVYQSFIGPVGTDFESVRGSMLTERLTPIVQRWGLEACCIDALLEAIAAYEAPERNARRVCDLLGHDAVSLAFCDWARNSDILDDEGFLIWLDEVIGEAGRRAAPALLVRAQGVDSIGDALGAEEDLAAAHALDPEFAPAAMELALFLVYRGEFQRAITMLNRIGGDGRAIADLFGKFQMDPGSVGRNDPCPCGSGKKFKACHLGKPVASEGDFVRALVTKLRVFISNPSGGVSALSLLALIASDGDRQLLTELYDDGFFQEIAMFDSTGLDDFRTARGELLTDEERDALDAWFGMPLGVWQVLSNRAGRLVAENISTRDSIEIEGLVLEAASAGDHFVFRVLPHAGRWWSTGMALPLEPDEAVALKALLGSGPQPSDIAAWFVSYDWEEAPGPVTP